MKKTIFVSIAAVFAFMSIVAQGPRERVPMSPEARMQTRLDRMKTELNLTDDQVAKLKEVFVAEQNKVQEMRKEAEGTQEANREKMKQMRDERDGKLKAILSPEQLTKFNEAQKRNFDEMRRNRDGRGDRPERDGRKHKSDTTVVKQKEVKSLPTDSTQVKKENKKKAKKDKKVETK